MTTTWTETSGEAAADIAGPGPVPTATGVEPTGVAVDGFDEEEWDYFVANEGQ